MRAVRTASFGGPEVLEWVRIPMPEPGPHQLLVRVAAAGVNRADILQRRGLYPPPPGESDILGLEIAGEVAAMGPQVNGFAEGDRVFGLVAGGGYAEMCLLDARLAIPVPSHWDNAFAAAIPETFMTANETLFTLGRLTRDETVLIHAGGSGVGSTAIQMAHLVGARVLTTAGSPEKLARCSALGAARAIHYPSEDFVAIAKDFTEGRGVHLVLDFIGAAYLARHLEVLGFQGRLILVGLLGGARAELHLGTVLAKRLQIFGFIMRRMPIAEKAAIKERFVKDWLPQLERGEIAPVLHARLPMGNVREAHAMMEASQHFGKMVLTFDH